MNLTEGNSTSACSIHQNKKNNQNIQVYVRVRPLNERDRSNRSYEVVDCVSAREIITKNTPESKLTKKFTFDRTFGQNSRQVDIYSTVVAPYIEEVLDGYNCTVFAYGQTGTGKTHTMIGTESPQLKSSWEDDSPIGIIPRALSHLFDELRLMDVEFSMRVSYLELYNEELIDLLSADDSVKIRIFDDNTKKGSIIIHGLEEIPVHSKDDVYRLLEAGKERRRTASTLINAQSSRSHTVFSILVHIRENNDDGEEMLKIGKLNLVDLAGSENISKAGNERGIRTRETVNINQSLLTLGRVITALVERTPHVPYRESKLTRLLQESLGGRTKTSIIATVSPGHKDIEETLSTLDYAHRARNIQNKPEVNQKLTKKTVLKEYTEEIDRLKRELTSAREKNGVYLPVERYEEISAQMESQNRELNEKMLHIKALKEEILKKDSIFNEVSSKLLIETNTLQNTRQDLLNTKTNLKKTKKALVCTKRRFEEHKVVLENQVKVEAELTSQAQQILEVTELATKDVEGLHKSIDRRKVLDKNIQSSVQEYTGKIVDKYELMNINLKSFRDQHHKVSEDIRQHLIFSTSVADSLLQDGIRQVRDMSQRNDENSMAMTNCSEKFRGLFDSLDVSHQSIVNDILESWNQLENQRNEYLNTHLGKLEELNLNIKLLMETLCSSTRQILLDNLGKTESFINCLQTQYDALYKSNELNANAVAKLQAQIDQHKLQELERQKILENCIVQMKKISSDNSVTTDNLQATHKELENGNSSINEILKSNSKSLDQFANACKDRQMKDAQATDAHLDLTNARSMEHTNLCSSMQTHLESYYKQYLMNNQFLKDEKSKYYVAEKDLWVNYEKELSVLSKEKLLESNMALKDIESLISNKVNVLKEENSTTDNLVSQIDKNISSYSQNHEDTLHECIKDAIELKERKLKSYTPSGETPAKRNYSFPNELVKSSPHEKIIQRFREKMNWKDLDYTDVTNIELNELNESYASDTSTSDKILNSTPLNNPLRKNSENITLSITSEDPLREIQKENISNDNLSTSSPLFMKRFRFQTSNKENIQGD